MQPAPRVEGWFRGVSVNEYIFVHRIDKDTELSGFIPLHMTVLHWFKSDKNPNQIAAVLEDFASENSAVETVAIAEAMFGPNQDIPVVRLDRTKELLAIHLGLLETVTSIGGQFDRRWVGKAHWSPHVTHRPEARIYVGDKVDIKDVDVFMKSPEGDRQLLATYKLGGRHV